MKIKLTRNQTLALIWVASPNQPLPPAPRGCWGRNALMRLERLKLVKSTAHGDLSLTPAGVRFVLRKMGVK